jgi:transposase
MVCAGKVPGNTGRRQSLVGVLSVQGRYQLRFASRLGPPQAGSLKAEDFAKFIKEHVVEHPQAGDVLVLDNARCHYSKQAKEAVEAVGARLLFLPAYSPDFSPIEMVWHQVKVGLRQQCPRTLEALQQVIKVGLERVTPETARAYFAHCGYQTLQHY